MVNMAMHHPSFAVETPSVSCHRVTVCYLPTDALFEGMASAGASCFSSGIENLGVCWIYSNCIIKDNDFCKVGSG